MKYLIQLIVGLFTGWLGERSRDKAHEDKGRAETKYKYEKVTKEKIEKAGTAGANVDFGSGGLFNDFNNRDN